MRTDLTLFNSILFLPWLLAPQLSQFPLFQTHVTFQYSFLKILMFAAPPETKNHNNYYIQKLHKILANYN